MIVYVCAPSLQLNLTTPCHSHLITRSLLRTVLIETGQTFDRCVWWATMLFSMFTSTCLCSHLHASLSLYVHLSLHPPLHTKHPMFPLNIPQGINTCMVCTRASELSPHQPTFTINWCLQQHPPCSGDCPMEERSHAVCKT